MRNITRQQISNLLKYNSSTGEIHWRVDRTGTARAGDLAGWVDARGRRVLRIFNESYLAHRVAWLLHYGAWPEGNLVHIDGYRANNAISNLEYRYHARKSSS